MSTAPIDWKAIKTLAFELDPFDGIALDIELPALPAAVTRFIERSEDPEATASELATIVETDSGMTAELLKHVNSARLNLLRTITSVAQAIAYLGIETTKVFVMTAGARASLRSFNCRLISPSCFWNESLQRAVFSREISNRLVGNSDLAFAAALLQDFILPVLTNAYPEKYKEYQRQEGQWKSICDFERATFGWDHAQAAAFVADQWIFPDELVCCIFHHHHIRAILKHPVLSNSVVMPVALSGLLPSQLEQVWSGPETLARLNTSSGFDLLEVSAIVDAQLEQAAQGKSLGFSLTEQLAPIVARSIEQNQATATVIT